jgi:hypothetical protein
MEQTKTQNLNVAISDLDDCLAVLCRINGEMAQRKIEIKSWQRYLEIQSIKFIFHTSSLVQLLRGTLLKSESKLIFDLGSIFLLRRAQLENYLMFYYLNIQPQANDEGELRKLFFDLGGLVHRQGYNATTDEHVQQKQKEADKIEVLVEKIKANTSFQSLPLQKRNDLLKRMPPRILGWEQMITSSHLKTTETIQLWKYYSNYAHSEMIGITQMAEFLQNPAELDGIIYITAEQTLITTLILLEDFFTTFPELIDIKAKLPLLFKAKIEFWNKIGKELSPILPK